MKHLTFNWVARAVALGVLLAVASPSVRGRGDPPVTGPRDNATAEVSGARQEVGVIRVNTGGTERLPVLREAQVDKESVGCGEQAGSIASALCGQYGLTHTGDGGRTSVPGVPRPRFLGFADRSHVTSDGMASRLVCGVSIANEERREHGNLMAASRPHLGVPVSLSTSLVESRIAEGRSDAASARLSPSADWVIDGAAPNTHFGIISAAGDVNGDGYDDVIVGAEAYDGDMTDEGAVYLFEGTSSGLRTTPSWVVEGNQAGAKLGLGVSGAGDVNGDGYGDVIIAARAYDDGEEDEGRVYVYHGSKEGLSTTPDWTVEGNQAGAGLGTSVGTAGDVNGDGYSDVIVGARYYDGGQEDEGKAYVYHGSEWGLSTSPDWTAEGDQPNAYFTGKMSGSAGDVNGDGYSDVIIGAPRYDNGQTDEGTVYVYHGSSAGLSTTPDWIVESDQVEARLGADANTAGDVNGDGFSDVIVAAYWYDNGESDEGQAFAYYGSATGLSTAADWTADTDQAGAGVAWANTVEDVNADGYDDVIIGSPWYDSAAGKAWIYYGSASGLNTVPAWTGQSDQAGSHYGWPAAAAGDVNGDGYVDVVVGAHAYPNYERVGRAYAYYSNVTLTPFLDLPFYYDGSVGSFQRALQSIDSAGHVSAWFDHKYPYFDHSVECAENPELGPQHDDRVTDFRGYESVPPSNVCECTQNKCYDGHDGIDFARLPEDPQEMQIRAAANGLVVTVTTDCVQGQYDCGGGFGNHVIL
jgi:hypothetical protein